MEKITKKFDAVLLAGDTGASRMVCNTNKSFLTINEVPLLMYVLRALEKAETINRICIIGPQDRVVMALEDHHGFLDHKKEITVCAQDETLFANAWKAFLHLTPEAQTAATDDTVPSDKAVFYLSGDIPLVTPFEIDTFIGLCDTDRYDYFLGIAPAENLNYFYPQKGRPGIKTNFFHIKEGRYRQNNFQLVKPLKVTNRHYIQKVYDYRYQRDMRNILKLAFEFLNHHVGLKGFWCYSLLHWHQFLSQIHLNPLTLPTRTLLPLSFIDNRISKVLGTRFTNTITPFVGAVLDIDNERDYKTMCTMFSSWQHYLKQKEEAVQAGKQSAQPPSLSGNNAA
jgi:molybdopterin-guanine dinucleotide biosynthesis protein A